MQRKLILSFGALLITNSFLVKVANAYGVVDLKDGSLTPVAVNEQQGEVKKPILKVNGLQEKKQGSKRIPNEQTTEVSGLSAEEKKITKNLSFKVLTNSIIHANTAVYITDRDSDGFDKKINGFNYNDSGYSINNTVLEGGRLYINKASVSRDTTIENGGIEFVKNLSISEYAVIKKGGKQLVGGGSVAEGAKIHGGEQIIFGKRASEGDIEETEGELQGSRAYDTVIYGQNEMLGRQNVYSNGMVFDTKIMRGGVQNLNGTESFNDGFTEDDNTDSEDVIFNDGASALNTQVFKNGVQNIFAGGNASNVTLYDNATQKIYDTGYADGLTINDQAKSWLHAGAILDKETRVNDFGILHIYTGNSESVAEIENLILNGEDTRFYAITNEDNGVKSQINIKNLSGNGKVIFTSSGVGQHYSQLNIDDLSGNIHFNLNVNFAEHRSDYLLIKKSSTDQHTISIMDSGLEITDFPRKKFKLISDRSGNARFTLANVFGEKINTLDVGTYMYSLKQRKNKKNGKIWYLDANNTIDETTSLISDLNFKPSNELSTDLPTELTIEKGKIVSIGNSNFENSHEGGKSSGSSNEELINNTVRDGGKIYVGNGGYSLYTKVKNGGVEVIKNQGISHDTAVYKGGQQKIENGGKAEDAKIYGGEQFVSGVNNIKGEMIRSSAEGTVISGQDDTRGYQNVYDGGGVFNTKIMEGGVQNLYVKDDLENYNSFAFDTEVFSGGEQNILAGGRAVGVLLQGTAFQKIGFGGYVKDLIIKDQAKSWLHHGATLAGSTMVNDFGRIYLYAGADRSRTKVEKIILNGKDTKLFSIASHVDGEGSLVENLSGHGSVIFTASVFNPHYSKLEINDLSGNLHFRFHINSAEQRGDYLFIKKGSGHHTISVIDSGVELLNSSPQKHTFFPELNLITDQSGKAHFTLVDLRGEEISTIDSGAYIYSLKQKNNEGEKIWYLVAENNFNPGEKKLILQDSVISNDSIIYISNDDEEEAGHFQQSINNTVERSGIIYVEAGGFSKNTIIQDGGFEIIREQGISEYAIVKKGGKQIVGGGAIVEGAKIYGGKQIVFGKEISEGGIKEIDNDIQRNRTYDTVSDGQNEMLGLQNVYSKGIVFDTKMMDGEIQNLNGTEHFNNVFTEDDDADDEDFASNDDDSAINTEFFKNGGLVQNTEVFSGGVQRVLAGGRADNVILHNGAVQEIYSGGYVRDLTIECEANSRIFAGALLEGKVLVNDSGQLYLYAGENNNQTRAEEINLSGKEARLYSVGSDFDGKISLIKKLNGMGRVIFTSAESDLYYSRLYVDDLSGNVHFDFNVNLAEGDGDRLFIKNGSGSHTVSIVDSGIEITNPASKNLDLIIDQSGGAHFALQKFHGAKIEAIDGGTYTYDLKQKNDENGRKKIWYLTAISIDSVLRKNDFSPHPDRAKETVVPSFSLLPTDKVIDSSDYQSDLSPQSSKEITVSHFLTSPSTDAVLSMSVAPGLIFHNELRTVRTGRGISDSSKQNAAFWTYALKSRENITADHIDFKLDQTGIILGINGLSELANGVVYIGGFGSYDQTHIAHTRGGMSGINTYGIGTYATYFDHNGWYLDGVLKYNRYQSILKAVSTNGLAIEGNYNQSAVGSSFEAGYRIKMAQSSWLQPYAQFTWLQVEGKEIKLSNKMIGDISPFTSLRSEIGLSLGYEFKLGKSASSLAHITIAWLRENKHDNHTTINQWHKFTTDLSGNSGKLGITLSSLVSNKLKLYAQTHYIKGAKIEKLLQGILGLHYSF